eukprot:gb/GFBE01050947.1/.p1 GENE.gb/GFBE01050947.1/~~gb/GFBE01050947.1/.p1  ORF type:complete len:103 (+),score=37.18 gb/GFBE01050947.1/:1-309(+)
MARLFAAAVLLVAANLALPAEARLVVHAPEELAAAPAASPAAAPSAAPGAAPGAAAVTAADVPARLEKAALRAKKAADESEAWAVAASEAAKAFEPEEKTLG